jgi:FKBP-type peptidyl-prolyl cis-trans isomerase
MKKIFVLILLLFIAGCSRKPEIVTLKSGIKYADDTVGTGIQAKFGDLVSIQYTVWLFQDSIDIFKDWSKDSTKMHSIIGSTKLKNEPVKFILDGLSFIKGSEEGITGMKVGGTRTIIIPVAVPNSQSSTGMKKPQHPSLKLQVKLVSSKQPVPVKPWIVDSTKLQTTKDGLRYIIIQEGSGPNVSDSNLVTVNYSGFLLNGDKFDSSVEREQPLLVRIGFTKLLAGWEEGLRLLNKGAKAKLIMPPSLAFGQKQLGKIPPNSTVVFDVEIVDIK